MEWLIADTHFGHKNILDFEGRPFETIEEMNQGLIQAWNQSVSNTDTVYMLGDLSLSGPKLLEEILVQLNGNIILIKGNHDKDKIMKKLLAKGLIYEYHPVGLLMKRDKVSYYLTHYPFSIGERPNLANISGHIHSNENDYINQFNVGVDSHLSKIYCEANDLPFGSPLPFKYVEQNAQTVSNQIALRYLKEE